MVKVSITTQGCSANLRESELMGGLLSNAGYDVSHDGSNAEVQLVNICTVKKDGTALREIRRLKKENPTSKIVVAGCITQTIVPKIKALSEDISLINTHNFGKIGSVVEQSLLGNQIELMDKRYEPKVDLPSVRKNSVVGIVPILNGCNYFCTFCSTKLVKGKLFSYPMGSIKNDVKAHLASGCKEIWITSNDTGAYMVEQGGKQKIVDLLADLLSIPLDFKLRVGMMNPGNTLPILGELIEIYKHPKMFKFLHIPLQAGSDEVLKGMNRQYSVEQFMEVVTAFKKQIPNLTLSTDIIVGFPNETEEQFEQTLSILRQARFDVVNISRFSPREGTIAAKMTPLYSGILKSRSVRLTNEFEKITEENNKNWLGWSGNILLDEIGKEGSFVGRNFAYKPVIVKGDFALGDILKVKITQTTIYDLRADVLSKESAL